MIVIYHYHLTLQFCLIEQVLQDSIKIIMQGKPTENQQLQLQNLAQLVVARLNQKCGKCRNCKYGRNRCNNPKSINYQLSPTQSTYLSSFKRNKQIPNNKIQIPIYKKNSQIVINNSSYSSQFPNRDFKDSPPKPIRYMDHLKQDGRIKTESSYKSDYQSCRCKIPKEQKIVNPQNWPLVNNIKMKNSTVYRDNYKANQIKKLQLIKREGSLKLNGDFYGESTYRHEYLPGHGQLVQTMKPKYKYSPIHFPHIQSTYHADYKSINPSTDFHTMQH